MPPKVGTDITAVPVGLFLVIVLDLPSNIVLGNYRKCGDVGEIGWM